MLLTVDNVFTHVDCTDQEASSLYSAFTVELPKKNRTLDVPFHRFFDKVRRRIATGLFPELVAMLDDDGLQYSVVDERSAPAKFPDELCSKIHKYDLKSPPYDYQYEALEAVRGNVVGGIPFQRGVLQLATNAGKTVIAAALIKTLNVRTLFLVGSNDLLMQTEQVLGDCLGKKIFVFGGGRKEVGEITVSTIQSLVRNFRARKHILQEYDLLVFDEVHHVTSDTWTLVSSNCPAYYRIGMSGTAFDPNDKYHNYRMMSATGGLLKEVTNEELIQRGVSAKPTVYLLESEYDEKVRARDWHTAYNKGIVNNEKRNAQIVRLCKFLVEERNHKVLLLTPRKLHLKKLFLRLRHALPRDAVLRANYGRIPPMLRKKNLEEFRRAGAGVMLATTIYDEGVDIPEVNTLILVGGWKSFRKLLQRIGRSLRKKQGRNVVRVYDFYDTCHYVLAIHSYERLKTSQREAFDIRPLGGARKIVDSLVRRGRIKPLK